MDESAEPLLRVSNLVYQYTDPLFSIGPIDIEVNGGEILGILGANGSGKSTLLQLLGGHLLPASGVIILNGRDVSGIGARDRPTSTVFQDFALFPHMTVVDNIAFGIRHRFGVDRAVGRHHAQQLAADTGLDSKYFAVKPASLSKGQQQRVAVARALAFEPVVLLLDEPTASLDAKSRDELGERLNGFVDTVRNRAVVLITHDILFAQRVCTRTIVMDMGKILSESETGMRLTFSPPSPDE